MEYNNQRGEGRPMSFIVKDTSRETERECSSRAKAEETKNDMISLGAKPENIEIVGPETADGGTEEIEAEIVEHTEESETQRVQDTTDALDELGESLGTDPLSILPGHMIDEIKGQPAINKRGYAMIAERYGVSVKSYIESYPWENDDNRCVARAVAVTEDGDEYQDFATAKEEDGDMSEQLIELASTRALKRVTGWATGLGIVSYQELAGELE